MAAFTNSCHGAIGALVIAFVLGTAAEPVGAQAPAQELPLHQAAMLARSILTAVNHGNLTGNYTVLRDLGAPTFRERNNSAQLAGIFQQLREQKIDLNPILVLEPQFTERPGINQFGAIQIVGFFPTQPLNVHFHLTFQRVAGGWLLDAVSIGTTDTSQQQSSMSLIQPQGAPNPPPPVGYPQ